jgi:cytochrome c6
MMVVVSLLGGCSNEAPRNGERSPAPPRQQLDRGAALFKQYCAACHPDGGNVSDPERSLHGSALRAHHITTPRDIVRIMRAPISRMIGFDVSTISDRDATAIADYVLDTFK